MILAEKVRMHKELSKKIAELEEQKKLLGEEILAQMENSTLHVIGYTVKKYDRLSIKLSIEDARALNAVKIEETIDKDKIKEMHKQGRAIAGVNETSYIVVTELNTQSQ